MEPVAITQSGTTLRPSLGNRAQVFRQGNGANEVSYLDFYVGDSSRSTGSPSTSACRYDRQRASAADHDRRKPAFPNVVPGVIFAGYDAPFTWNNFSPRAA